MNNKKKIGLIFGTFDPIHIGHLCIATTCLNNGFDKVYFIPSYNPFKQNQNVTEFDQRYDMIKLAITNSNNNIEVSRVEHDIYYKWIRENDKLFPGNYTYDVIETLKKEYVEFKDCDLHLIVGADCFFEIHKWYSYRNLLKEFKPYVINRNDFSITNCLAYCQLYKIPSFKIDEQVIKMPRIDISSTILRDLIRNNKCTDFFIPEKVYTFIKENNLYK